MNFSEENRIVPILSKAAAAATDRTSEVIDVEEFDGCCIAVHFGAIGATTGQSIKLSHSDAATETALTNGEDVAGSAVAVLATDDNQVKYLDFKPTKRYYQLTVDKDGTATSEESAIAYLYRGDKPAAHAGVPSAIGDGAAAVAGKLITSVADGTA